MAAPVVRTDGRHCTCPVPCANRLQLGRCLVPPPQYRLPDGRFDSHDHPPIGRPNPSLALFNRAGFHDIIENTLNVNVTITKQKKIAKLREDMIAEGKTPEEIAAVFGSLTNYEVEGTARDVTGTDEDPYADEEY